MHWVVFFVSSCCCCFSLCEGFFFLFCCFFFPPPTWRQRKFDSRESEVVGGEDGWAQLLWFTVSRSMKAATAAHLSYSKNHNSHKHNWNFIECKTTGSKFQFLRESTCGGEIEFTFSQSCKEDIWSFLFSFCAGFPLSSFSPTHTVGCGEALCVCFFLFVFFFLYFPC